MKKNLMAAIWGVILFMPVSHAAAQESVNADINKETSVGTSTSMNGNTSTNSGAAISSTAAGAASRNASGSGE